MSNLSSKQHNKRSTEIIGQRAVIRVHAKLGASATKTYGMMQQVYEVECLSKTVYLAGIRNFVIAANQWKMSSIITSHEQFVSQSIPQSTVSLIITEELGIIKDTTGALKPKQKPKKLRLGESGFH